jgi:hypothetical protein
MSNNNIKAEIATVNVRDCEYEGLVSEQGEIGIAVSQLCKVGLIPPNRSANQLKSICQCNIKFQQWITPLNPKPVNVFVLPEFEKLLDSFSNAKQPKRKNAIKKAEQKIQDKLHKIIGGQVEVPCLAGAIDLVTATEIIEIKCVKNWKHAIGQVLVYGHYYPSHQKKIHLFGETQAAFLDMIQDHCKELNILMTWEL